MKQIRISWVRAAMLLALLIIGLFSQNSSLAQSNTYWTFDTNNENFETYTLNEENTPWPFMTIVGSAWSATGGHQDGHIYSGTTTDYNDRFYAIWQNGDAAAPTLGNLLNKTVQTGVMRDVGSFQSPSGEKVLAYWAIGDSLKYMDCNLWLSKQAYAIDVNALTQGQWTVKSIDFIEANFFPWANCDNPKTFAELANSYKYIGFSFLSDQVTTNAADPWNQYVNVGGVNRLPHYGTISADGAIFRIDNSGPTTAMVYDFGDLPDTYHTTHASNGPRHQIGGTLMLGNNVQSEPDASPNNTANGETGEEDGVTRQDGLAGNGWTEGTVASSQGGSLSIDIQGGSGVPQVFMALGGSSALAEVTLRDASGTALSMPLSAGLHRVYFDIPANTFTANSNNIPVRVRLSSGGGLTSTGVAADGEVEDYLWNFGPNALHLASMRANALPAASWLLLMGILLLAGLAGLARTRIKQ